MDFVRKKYPFEKLIIFLLLARNEYKPISKFLSEFNLGEASGKELVTFEHRIKKIATKKEAGLLNTFGPSSKRKSLKKKAQKSTDEVVQIVTNIPYKFKRIASKLGITSSPFDSENVMAILKSNLVKRAIEVYLTSRMNIKEVVGLINDKFRLSLTIKDVSEYREWFYDLSGMYPDEIIDYFSTLDRSEQDYKRMAYMAKPDYIKWKMRDDFDVDISKATKNILSEAYYNFVELCNNKDRISHNAIKVWSDIYFRSAEYIHKADASGTNRSDIYRKVRIMLSRREDIGDEIISYEELMSTDGDPNDEEE